MRHRSHNSLQCLTRECTTRLVGNSNREHHRKTAIFLLKDPLGSSQRSLGIERIKYRLNEQQIHTAIHQRVNLLHIGRLQRIKVRCTQRRVIHIGRNRETLCCWADRSRHKTRLIRSDSIHSIYLSTSKLRRLYIQSAHTILQTIFCLRNTLAIECTGLDNLRSRLQILAMNCRNNIWTRKDKHVIITLKAHVMVHKLNPSKVIFREVISLNHSTHSAVQNDDSLGQNIC